MSPELAIVLVTDSFAAIATTLAGYRAAVDPARTELVVAVVGGARITPAELAATGFPHVQIVDGGDGALQTAEWRAFSAVRAPLVVFAQAHVRPRPGFGAALRDAWAGGQFAVVGPVAANANPETLVSRVAMWLGFGRWTDAAPRGPASDVPGHNSAYDRAALIALGDELPELLEAGWQLQVALTARGQRCFLEPAACVEVVNPTRVGPCLVHFFRLGRLVAGQRARHWSPVRRLAYALGAPLIPFLRLWRIVVASLRRRTDTPWEGVPLLVLALVASAAGEAAGFLTGAGPPARFRRLA